MYSGMSLLYDMKWDKAELKYIDKSCTGSQTYHWKHRWAHHFTKSKERKNRKIIRFHRSLGPPLYQLTINENIRILSSFEHANYHRFVDVFKKPIKKISTLNIKKTKINLQIVVRERGFDTRMNEEARHPVNSGRFSFVLQFTESLSW